MCRADEVVVCANVPKVELGRGLVVGEAAVAVSRSDSPLRIYLYALITLIDQFKIGLHGTLIRAHECLVRRYISEAGFVRGHALSSALIPTSQPLWKRYDDTDAIK